MDALDSLHRPLTIEDKGKNLIAIKVILAISEGIRDWLFTHSIFSGVRLVTPKRDIVILISCENDQC